MKVLRIAENLANESKKIGVHAIADIIGVDSVKLQNEEFLMAQLRKSLQLVNFTIMGEKSLKFPGKKSGVTGLYILSESHAVFHTYPEYNYLGVDIFSCGKANPREAIRHFSKFISAENCNLRIVDRGSSLRLNDYLN